MSTGPKLLKSFTAAILSLLFAAQTSFAITPIVTDGNTATTVTTAGNVTDVTTATVRGDTAFNSFNQFDVKRGKTVNLHLPGGTDNLLNLVHKRKTKIDGILNGYQNGQIGGNVFFLNPYGVAVSSSGVVNVGSFTAITPTKEFMQDFFSGPGNPSAAATASVLAGDVPLRGFAAIAVDGQINAERDVTLMAGDVTVKGAINAGAAAQSAVGGFGSFVNVNGVEVGADLIVDNGTVKIVALDDVTVTGEINVDGKAGVNGGSIAIDAGDAITVEKNAVISAQGQGAHSDGGEIIILAQDDASLQDNAVIDASAGTSGDGGFIEFSAKDEVDVEGGQLLASALNGLPGTILLDPVILNLDIDVFTAGANMIFEADEEINVNGVTVSSRQIAGADHVNDASIGDSGDLEFIAPEINFNDGSQILAHTTDGFAGGTISALATTAALEADEAVSTSITAVNSLFKAAGIDFQAVASNVVSGLTESDGIISDVGALVDLQNSMLDAPNGAISLYAGATGASTVSLMDSPDALFFEQSVSAAISLGAGSVLTGDSVQAFTETINTLDADLSNSDNTEYADVSGVFSYLASDSRVEVDAGVDIQSSESSHVELWALANSVVNIDVEHVKPDAETPSAVMAVSEVDSNAEATVAADLDVSILEVYAFSEIESDVSATTVFPVSITALMAAGEAELADLPFTMTVAASQHNNRAKSGFINGAVINTELLALAALARDESVLNVDPGASTDHVHIKGIVDGDFQSIAELCFRENADVTVNERYLLEIANVAPESIDGLSEVAKQEATSELGANPMFTKLWKLQSNSASQSESSYEYAEEWEASEDSDETSDMTSDSGSTMDSGGDSGEGYSYEYTTESSYDTSSDSSSSSSSSSTSSSTSEETSESESSSESDSTFEFEAESSSSSSSSSTP